MADVGFEIACRAFELFTLAEKRAALERFASLRYVRVEDRMVEAVHSVIQSMSRDVQAATTVKGTDA